MSDFTQQWYTALHTDQVVPLAKDGEGMINQVCKEKDVLLTTGQSVPAPKDGEEVVNTYWRRNNRRYNTNSPEPLADQQGIDLESKQWKDYLLRGRLPEDEKKARELVLERSQFEVKDEVLYHVEKDRVFPPSGCRKELFDDVHKGVFGAHLRSAKIHSHLAQHYWWPLMENGNWKLSPALYGCASRNIGNCFIPS